MQQYLNNQVMQDCQNTINDGLWLPIVDDCHTHLQNLLKRNGLNSPYGPYSDPRFPRSGPRPILTKPIFVGK
jgi:hypothetical protein